MQGIVHSVRIASQHDITADPHLPCRYILQPAENLPLLDLSRTLQSVLFSRSWDAAIKRFLRRYGHLFSVGYLVASILHTAIILVPLKEGRNLAIVAAFLGLPTVIFSILRLRADIVRALIQSFDVVFSVFLITLTFGVLAVMADDIRAIVDFEAWLSAFVNIFIDANIQAVRQIVFVSSFSVVSALCLLLVVVFELLPGVKHFDLVRIGQHTLTATDVVTSGLLTILVLLARNIYRNRHILLKRSNGTIVECVSYRCRLRFHVTSGQRRMRNNLNARRRHSMDLKSTMPHLQPMRYASQLTLINAERIIHPAFFRKLERNPPSFRRRCRGFGLAAAILALIVGLYELYTLDSPPNGTEGTLASFSRLLAMALTTIYVVRCTFARHLGLLRLAITSFDFQFLAVQVTFMHFSLADFFELRRSCWLLLATWQWALWLLTIDTLTPTVRIHLGLDWWFVRVVWIGAMLSAGVVAYVILFSSMSTRIFDRVLWRGLGPHGYTVEYRLLIMFCSVLMTTMAFWMRLGWHIWRASGDELVVLDGPVTFVNYLRISKSDSTLEHRVQVRTLPAH